MKTGKQWDVFPAEDHVSVLPLEDIQEHEDTPECACAPILYPKERTDWKDILVHNAFDGRELVERHGLQ